METIEMIDIKSERFPQRLREISDPPGQLYCLGDTSLLNSRSVAVVGSRKNTVYGKNVALMIGKRLAECGIPVVSGLALGVDAFSHEGALNAEGKIIGVLGSGIDMMSPERNKRLMERGLEMGGLIISEYPPGMPASKYTFPKRNRIISGLSESVIIVEAGLNSGSLITARHAANQGKTVYAVPGNINSKSSIGCNLLVRDGAIPLIVIDDVVRDLGIEINPADDEIYELDEDEKTVFDSVRSRSGATIDEICADTMILPSRVNSLITVMEIKGLVESYAGRIYAK